MGTVIFSFFFLQFFFWIENHSPKFLSFVAPIKYLLISGKMWRERERETKNIVQEVQRLEIS